MYKEKKEGKEFSTECKACCFMLHCCHQKEYIWKEENTASVKQKSDFFFSFKKNNHLETYVEYH